MLISLKREPIYSCQATYNIKTGKHPKLHDDPRNCINKKALKDHSYSNNFFPLTCDIYSFYLWKLTNFLDINKIQLYLSECSVHLIIKKTAIRKFPSLCSKLSFVMPVRLTLHRVTSFCNSQPCREDFITAQDMAEKGWSYRWLMNILFLALCHCASLCLVSIELYDFFSLY